MASDKSLALRCLRRAAKAALIGAVCLGVVAVAYVCWDAYNFYAAGHTSHHPVRMLALNFAVLGATTGGVLGAVVGVGIELAKGRA
jgi:hypothetical protein